jgi:hypothetical protein
VNPWLVARWAVVGGALVAAQGGAVPVDQEPRHHLKLANADTRVFDVTVPASDTTRFHIHARDYVFVTFGGANLRAQALGADATPLVLTDGEVRFTKGPITHRVWNPSGPAFHNLTIEVLGTASESARPLPARSGTDSVVLENDRVRAVRVTLPASGQSTHQHDGPWLVVAVHAGRVQDEDAGSRTSLVLDPATFAWHAEAGRHRMTNPGGAALELIEVEFKAHR